LCDPLALLNYSPKLFGRGLFFVFFIFKVVDVSLRWLRIIVLFLLDR
jgi:hypothetical protein